MKNWKSDALIRNKILLTHKISDFFDNGKIPKFVIFHGNKKWSDSTRLNYFFLAQAKLYTLLFEKIKINGKNGKDIHYKNDLNEMKIIHYDNDDDYVNSIVDEYNFHVILHSVVSFEKFANIRFQNELFKGHRYENFYKNALNPKENQNTMLNNIGFKNNYLLDDIPLYLPSPVDELIDIHLATLKTFNDRKILIFENTLISSTAYQIDHNYIIFQHSNTDKSSSLTKDGRNIEKLENENLFSVNDYEIGTIPNIYKEFGEMGPIEIQIYLFLIKHIKIESTVNSIANILFPFDEFYYYSSNSPIFQQIWSFVDKVVQSVEFFILNYQKLGSKIEFCTLSKIISSSVSTVLQNLKISKNIPPQKLSTAHFLVHFMINSNLKKAMPVVYSFLLLSQKFHLIEQVTGISKCLYEIFSYKKSHPNVSDNFQKRSKENRDKIDVNDDFFLEFSAKWKEASKFVNCAYMDKDTIDEFKNFPSDRLIKYYPYDRNLDSPIKCAEYEQWPALHILNELTYSHNKFISILMANGHLSVYSINDFEIEDIDDIKIDVNSLLRRLIILLFSDSSVRNGFVYTGSTDNDFNEYYSELEQIEKSFINVAQTYSYYFIVLASLNYSIKADIIGDSLIYQYSRKIIFKPLTFFQKKYLNASISLQKNLEKLMLLIIGTNIQRNNLPQQIKIEDLSIKDIIDGIKKCNPQIEKYADSLLHSLEKLIKDNFQFTISQLPAILDYVSMKDNKNNVFLNENKILGYETDSDRIHLRSTSLEILKIVNLSKIEWSYIGNILFKCLLMPNISFDKKKILQTDIINRFPNFFEGEEKKIILKFHNIVESLENSDEKSSYEHKTEILTTANIKPLYEYARERGY
ncbi:hypothetical protein TRFO_13809 [Tritrichomonas foetus]|uniref:Uncharacterized protein n=1 Tax=Tritrichomonas foetus TaxID=1144522 RepID=A0A1J4KY37_9EUKA|nr:hypothetical protein TRFO_13809 [Tritrichomonas foetus]|eukprot:OHT15800.1 hypothetical protein TRFO_13809 [Tritrichomonas foetus]